MNIRPLVCAITCSDLQVWVSYLASKQSGVQFSWVASEKKKWRHCAASWIRYDNIAHLALLRLWLLNIYRLRHLFNIHNAPKRSNRTKFIEAVPKPKVVSSTPLCAYYDIHSETGPKSHMSNLNNFPLHQNTGRPLMHEININFRVKVQLASISSQSVPVSHNTNCVSITKTKSIFFGKLSAPQSWNHERHYNMGKFLGLWVPKLPAYVISITL